MGAQGGSKISTRWEDSAGGSAVLLMLSQGLEIELTNFEAENAMLNDDYFPQVVEIVIGGVPTFLEICVMCLLMPIGRILLQGSLSMTLFNPVRHQVDLRNVEVRIELLGNISLTGDDFPPGIHFVPLLGIGPKFSICFIVYLLLLHKFCSHGIGFGVCLVVSSPNQENHFEGAIMRQGVVHVDQCCIIVRFILNIHIEF
jgi:hypothetical protein